MNHSLNAVIMDKHAYLALLSRWISYLAQYCKVSAEQCGYRSCHSTALFAPFCCVLPISTTCQQTDQTMIPLACHAGQTRDCRSHSSCSGSCRQGSACTASVQQQRSIGCCEGAGQRSAGCFAQPVQAGSPHLCGHASCRQLPASSFLRTFWPGSCQQNVVFTLLCHVEPCVCFWLMHFGFAC